MTLKSKIHNLNEYAGAVQELTRKLNIECSELNGVAANIPADAPAPAEYFRGGKVILHNVSYDHVTGAILATITIPQSTPEALAKLPSSSARAIAKDYAGHKRRVCIDETWFK